MLLKINIKVFAITILAMVLASSAEAISRDELISFLKPALRSYFENPADSKFTKEELRDFLLLFFETEGNDIDLNKVGQYSSKSLIELYQKGKVAKWTIMVFMNGDNNLEKFASVNINEMENIEDFLINQKRYRINTIGLTPSPTDNKLYQGQFPRLHFESLMDVVVPRCPSVIADWIEKHL